MANTAPTKSDRWTHRHIVGLQITFSLAAVALLVALINSFTEGHVGRGVAFSLLALVNILNVLNTRMVSQRVADYDRATAGGLGDSG